MGKVDSHALCSMHNLNKKLYSGYSFEQLLSLNCALTGVRASEWADENPDFEKTDALYAFRVAMTGEDEDKYDTYKPYNIKYDKNFEHILNDLLPVLENWLCNKSVFDQKAYNILAFLHIALNDMGGVNEILDLFLQQEEQSMKVELGLGMPLCALSDFERWHDNKYGNPIIGEASNHNKNVNEKSSASAYGTVSSSTGGVVM